MLVIGLQVTTALFTNRSKVNAVTSNHKTRAETLLPLPVDSWKMHVLNVKTDVQAQHVDYFEQPQNKQRNQGTTFLQNHLMLKLFPWGRSRSLDSWWRTLCNADMPVCVQLPRHLELFAQGLILWKANYQVTKGHLTLMSWHWCWRLKVGGQVAKGILAIVLSYRMSVESFRARESFRAV